MGPLELVPGALELLLELSDVDVELTKFGSLAHRIVARVDQLGGEVVDSSIQVVDHTVQTCDFSSQLGHVANAILMLDRADLCKQSLSRRILEVSGHVERRSLLRHTPRCYRST